MSASVGSRSFPVDEAERYTRVIERWSEMLQSAEPNGRPTGKIKFGWICQEPGADGSVDDNYIVVDDDDADGRKTLVATAKLGGCPMRAANADCP